MSSLNPLRSTGFTTMMNNWLFWIVIINHKRLNLIRRTLWTQSNHFLRRVFFFFLLTATSFLVDFLPSV